MWNNPSTPKPLGLNCRYFNLQNPAATEEQRKKLLLLQQAYVSQESKILIAGCGDLDSKVRIKDRSIIVTVRQLFLNLRSDSDPTRRILYGIERIHNKPGHYFLRMPRPNYDELNNRMDRLESDLRSAIEPADYHLLVSDTTVGLHAANTSLAEVNPRRYLSPPTAESQKDLDDLFSSFGTTSSVQATVFTSTTTTVTRDVVMQGQTESEPAAKPAGKQGSQPTAWGQTNVASTSEQRIAHSQLAQYANSTSIEHSPQGFATASSMQLQTNWDISSLRHQVKREITTVTNNVTRIEKVVTELSSDVKSFRQEHRSYSINFQRLCDKLGVETAPDDLQDMQDTAMNDNDPSNSIGTDNRND
jgi:hypothetical protein